MTIPSTTRKAGPLLGTGAQTTWPFTFKVFATTDILVTTADSLGVETVRVINTDYSVALNANQETSPGGTVTYPLTGSALPVSGKLTIIGNLPYDQPLDLPSGGNFSPLALENELDRLTMQVQQVEEVASRAVQVPVTSSASPLLPAPEANALLGWNTAATAMQNYPLEDIATAISFATYRFNTFTGNGSTTQFALDTDPAVLGNMDVAIDGFTQVPGVDYVLTAGNAVFTVAPSNGAEILVRYGQALISVSADANDVSYTPAGTGAVATTVQAVLRETVSVTRFGAVGDGVTNNIAAFIAVAATLQDGDSLFIPDGDYVFDFSTYAASPIYPGQGIIGLASKTGIRIYGHGAKLRITNLNTQTKGGWSIFWLNNCSDITIEGLVMDVRGVTGLTVAAPEPNYPIISAVAAYGTTWRNLTIKDCEFTSYNPLGAAPNPSGSDFNYKQIPVYVAGDTSADVVRGFRFINNVMRDINTYKMFLFGVGGVEITGNKFLNIAGLYPCIRNLIHASRGHVISNNYFEGLDPADDDAPNNIESTDTPQMVVIGNATNKGGGGASIVGNTFALTGSGGVFIADSTGSSVIGNTFYDRVDMSAVFTVEDNTKAGIRLSDEATGAGSYPAQNVTVANNAVLGTVTRKPVEITHALNGSVTGNTFDSAAGYGIKAARARRFVLSDNIIANVSSLSAAQAAILVVSSGAVLAAGETVSVFNNRIFGTAGTAIGTSSFDNTKVFINNNYSNGGITERTAGVQDQLKTDFLTFRSAAGTVSSGANDLDWYEEGTFTPVVAGTTAGVGTYTYQVGNYTRIGDTVHFRLSVSWTAHTGSGNTLITGLPFVSKNTANEAVPCSIWQGNGPIPGANKMRIAAIFANNSRIDLREMDLTTMVTGNSNAITATGFFYISGIYKV